MKCPTYKYDAILFRLKTKAKSFEIDKMTSKDFSTMVHYSIAPEDVFRAKRMGVKDLRNAVFGTGYRKIKLLQGVSDKDRLIQEWINTKNKANRQKTSLLSKGIGRKILRKVGNGVETATTGLNFAQGGVDTAAGSDIIERAHDLKAKGEIDENEYNEMVRNGQLRIAQGSFGLANGMKSVVKFVGKRVEKNVLNKATAAGVKMLKQAKRFGSVVGGIVAVGTGIVSMTKNAIAASDAAKKGLVGKAILYGVMAAVDGVTAILDGVSVALDIAFPPLSPIIDLISTILQVANTVIGFFADLVDFRTTEERVRDEFDTYLKSEAFRKYITNMADEYKKRDFDVFKYYVDADVAGIEADKETLQARKKELICNLTTRAMKDFEDPYLRLALLDVTSVGKTLRGRLNDDEIIAGFGPDCIYGDEGDDVLFGRGEEDTIYGGPGNDYLNGGTGRDRLLGGKGDDFIVCEPGVDHRCAGGEGKDTLALSGKSFIYEKRFSWDTDLIMMNKLHPPSEKLPQRTGVTGVYIDMRGEGKAGISLGSCFPGWPDGFNEFFHKPAFTSPDDLLRLLVKYFREQKKMQYYDNGSRELKNKMLWFLGQSNNGMKYFCDGTSLYKVSGDPANTGLWVIRNAINDISPLITRFENGRVRYSYYKKVEAYLMSAFRGTLVDKFEIVTAARPDDLAVLTHYVPTTVLGSDDHNVIDLSYSLGDTVYTGEGNNVISIGSSVYINFEEDNTEKLNPHGIYTWAKYIVGGSGDNTLIIQFMPIPSSIPDRYLKTFGKYESWVLINIHQWQKATPKMKTKNRYVVFLENITTVEIRSPESLHGSVSLDAELYDGASRYILNHSDYFLGPKTGKKGITVSPRRLFKISEEPYPYKIDLGRQESKSTISFKYYEDERYSIDTIDIGIQGVGFISLKPAINPAQSEQRITLVGATNVFSFPSCLKIIGDRRENLLIANGGKTTIEANDGDDTLVSTRGIHELIGGPGVDTYVLHGPVVTDYLTISIIKGADGNSIRCETTLFGTWMANRGLLYIHVLKYDHEDVLLNTAEIIRTQDDEGKNLGTILKDEANKKLIYQPDSNFDFLEKNKAKTIRIKYTTTGSMASIKEQDYGNQLRFESIKGLDDLAASIKKEKKARKKSSISMSIKRDNLEDNYMEVLVFTDKSNRQQTVLADYEWGNRLKNGMTSVFDLIEDFAQRFPVMLFRKDKKQFTRVAAQEIVKFLSEQLKHLVTDLGQDYDTYIDSTNLRGNVGDEIYVGNGHNVVVAKTKGKTYKLGPKSSGSIIVAREFTEDHGDVTVEGGDDPNSLNAVVVGTNSGAAVEIRMGAHDLIISGALMHEVRIHMDKDDNVRLTEVKSQQDLINGWDWRRCEKLIFKKLYLRRKINISPNPHGPWGEKVKKGETTQIIFDCRSFVNSRSQKQHSKRYKPIIVSYRLNKLLQLKCPFNKDDAKINVDYDDREKSFWVYLSNMKPPESYPYSDVRYPYLVVPADRNRVLELKVLVNALRFQFRRGIKFFDGAVKSRQICEFVVDKFKEDKISVDGYDELVNSNFKCD